MRRKGKRRATGTKAARLTEAAAVVRELTAASRARGLVLHVRHFGRRFAGGVRLQHWFWDTPAGTAGPSAAPGRRWTPRRPSLRSGRWRPEPSAGRWARPGRI